MLGDYMSKNAELKAMRAASRRTQSWITIGIIILGAVLIAGVLIWPSLNRKPVVTNPRPMANYTSMGDSNAPVKVEEFSDYQCPYCKLWATEQEPSIVKTYVATGKVLFTYTPYSFLGQESVKAAEAAYCAADQGKFWEYHDLIFSNQSGENKGAFSRNLFVSMANDLKLDSTAFQTCIDNNTNAKKVQDNLAYGKSKNVSGTPYFLVNDKLVDSSGLVPAIEEALKTK
jgi:protein-disulfide isomerase